MSFKKTLIFLLIFLLLGGYYYVVEVRMTAQKQAVEETEKLLFAFQQADIQRITLTREHEDILLAKEDGVWNVTQPVRALADAAAVESLLAEFVRAERQRTIADAPNDVEEFGLNAPQLVASVQTQAQEAPLRLTFGNETPTAAGYYARVGENKAVILVSSTLKTAVDKTLYDLRDKTVLDFDPAQIKKAIFEVKSAGQDEPATFEATQENAQWRITEPGRWDADSAKIASLLSAIKGGNVQSFVSETPDDLAQYGLESPERSLTLILGEDATQKTLLLGKRDAEKGGVYAQHAATGGVFLIPDAVVADFPASVKDIRDASLLSFSNDDIEKVELNAQTETITLIQDAPDVWKIAQPAEFQADSAKVRRLLSDARNLTATEFVDDAPADLGQYGLDAPTLRIRLWERDTDARQELLIGKANEDGSGRYAMLNAQNAVVLVSAMTLEQLPKTAFELRHKKMLPFDREQIAKIRIAYQETTLALEKDGNAWRSTEPEKQELQTYLVNNLLYDLESLEFTAEPVEAAEDMSRYGLNQPHVTVTLFTEQGEQVVSAMFGNAPDAQDAAFVKTSAGASIYPIDPAFLQELPASLSDLTE